MLKFRLTKEVDVRISKQFLRKRVDRLEQVLKKRLEKMLLGRDGEIELVFINDRTIQAMNKEYRSKDKPTDVISFAYMEVTDYEKTVGDIMVGDIFISIDTATAQAEEKGHSWKKEVEILFVHGMLHCLGFDHNNDEEEAEMEGWAEKILRD